MDFYTDVPSGHAPKDLMERAARIEGMRFADPSDTVGAEQGLEHPTRLLRGGRAESWADIVDAFGDFGFRLHPDTADFPAVAYVCATTADGRALTVQYCEGDLAVAEHPDVPAACAWIGGIDPTEPGSRFAFRT